jgi:hypothetical protein
MKTIIVVAALIALIAPPASAQSRGKERSAHAGIYQRQKLQRHIDLRRLYLSGQRSSQPIFNPDPAEQWPCSTAPDFCPNFHGDNS